MKVRIKIALVQAAIVVVAGAIVGMGLYRAQYGHLTGDLGLVVNVVLIGLGSLGYSAPLALVVLVTRLALPPAYRADWWVLLGSLLIYPVLIIGLVFRVVDPNSWDYHVGALIGLELACVLASYTIPLWVVRKATRPSV